MNCQFTVLLGTYVLGAADAAERRRLEGHLPGCGTCRQELMRLAPLPGLLSRVPDHQLPEGLSAAAVAARGTAATGRAGRGRPGFRRPGFRRPGRMLVATAAAAVAGLAAGLVSAASFGIARGPAAASGPHNTVGGGVHAAKPQTVVFTGADRVTHVEATAAVTPTSWGAKIELRLRGVPTGITCQLVVHSRSGGEEIAGVWNAWSKGPVAVPGSAPWRPSDIANLQVTTARGSLVTISPPPGSSSRG
jgi:hypothetical protein